MTFLGSIDNCHVDREEKKERKKQNKFKNDFLSKKRKAEYQKKKKYKEKKKSKLIGGQDWYAELLRIKMERLSKKKK